MSDSTFSSQNTERKHESSDSNIILTGFMGTGKSAVGRALASRMGYAYVDTDDIITEMAGMSISEIFATHGEPYFRELEKQAIQQLLTMSYHVVSTGGGAIIFDENIEIMKRAGILICLKALPRVIYERIKDDVNRPLLQVSDPLRRIKEILEQRESQYNKADILIDTSHLDIDGVVEKIFEELQRHKWFEHE